MTHQEKLMKDWSPKRRVEALSIVSSNLPLFMKYNEEELMALQQNNQDAFDLLDINPQFKNRLLKVIVKGKYLELPFGSKKWIDDLLKASETSQVTNEILNWWWKGDIQKGYIYPYLSDDKWNLSFINRFKFWLITIIMPICTGVTIPSSLKKYPHLFRQSLTLASIFLVEKSWYKEITDNTVE